MSLSKRLSKRAKKKLDKQLADKNVSEIEKKLLLEQAKGETPKDMGMLAP